MIFLEHLRFPIHQFFGWFHGQVNIPKMSRLKFSSICILIKGLNSTIDSDLRSSIMDNILWVLFFSNFLRNERNPSKTSNVKACYNNTFWARKCTIFWVHFVLFWWQIFFHFI